MSLLEEFEKILALEEARRSGQELPEDKDPKNVQGWIGSWMASFREWKASVDRRPPRN